MNNSSFIDFRRESDHQIYSSAVEYLIDDLSITGHLSLIRQCLTFVLQELFYVHNKDDKCYLAIPADYNQWANCRYSNPARRSTRCLEIIKFMIDRGYLDWHKGFEGQVRGFVTRIRPTKLLSEYIFPLFTTYQIRYYRHPASEVVFLKDCNKRYIDVPDTQFVIQRRSFLKKYNLLMKETDISFVAGKEPSNDVDFFRTDTYSVHNRGRIRCGGRFYGHCIQGVNKDYRKHLLMNGMPCIELDYCALHPYLLYAEAGAPYIGKDPYTIDGFNRDMVKSVMLIAFNASNFMKAYYAHCKEREKKEKLLLTVHEFGQIYTAFKNAHPMLIPYLCSDKGIYLQYQDSLIAERVIKHFVKRSIPIVCIHDSFVVNYKHADELRDVMGTAYQAFTKSCHVPKIELANS